MPANLIYDKSGNLVLFVVGENIYDKNGYLIDNFTNIAGFTNKQFNPYGEIAIIPAPCDCNYYWIVATHLDISNPGPGYYTETYSVLIDMNQPNPNFPGTNAMGTVIKHQSISGGPCTGLHCAFTEIAVTPPKSNQQNQKSYFLYVYNWEGVQKFIVDCKPDSITSDPAQRIRMYQDPTFTTNWTSACGMSGELNAEGEIFSNSDGTYRLALVSCQQIITLFDLDANGYVMAGNNPIEINVSGFQNYGQIHKITGLEFSENGRYLYFTAAFNNNTGNLPYISYIDLTAANLSPVPLNVSSAADFKSSFIELGYDHKLYFATYNRLASLADSDNPNSAWTNNALPVTIQGQQTFNYLNYYLLPDQIDGLNYDDVVATGYDYSSYTASGTATWTPNQNPFNTNGGNTVYIENELRIPEDANITIQNMVFAFGPNGKVIIENAVNTSHTAGKLTIDNTVLTAADTVCGNMWQGVRVWGVPWRPQNPFDPNALYQSQGEFYMMNNSRIENAYTGILAGKYGSTTDFDLNYSGGYVQCMQSEFRNNRVSVEFAPYNSDDYSYIVRCDFENSKPLFNPAYEFTSFIRIEGMHIPSTPPYSTISGNTFTNSLYQSLPADKWGTGVYSFNSSFSFDNNTVNNLFRGIDGNGILNPKRVITAKDNVFNNTEQGILLRGTLNDYIYRNEFHVPDHTSSLITNTFAVKADNTLGITILDNNVYTTQGYQAYGIIARETGSNSTFSGLIKLNYIYDTYRGIQTELFNTQLSLRCNYMENSAIGLSVNPQSPFGALKDQGTACNDPTTLPGNEFNIPCNNTPVHIRSTIDFVYYEDEDDIYHSVPSCVWNVWTNQQIVGYTSCGKDGKVVSCVLTIADTISNSDTLKALYLNENDPELKNQYWSKLFRAYVLEGASDSVLFSMLDTLSTKDGLYARIGLYYDAQNYTAVQNILDTMSLGNADDSLIHDYYSILNAAAQAGRGLYALDSTDLLDLNNLINQSASYMTTIPENILKQYNGYTYDTNAEDWAQNKMGIIENDQTIDQLSVYPIPADKVIRIENMNGNALSGSLFIHIYDISGKVVIQGQLIDLLTNHQLDVSNLNEGLYFMSVVDKEELVLNRKILIIHE